MHRFINQAVFGAALGLASSALAADFKEVPVAPVFTGVSANLSRLEIRGGVLSSLWGPESGDLYVNAELIVPKLWRWEGWADMLLPRARLGVMGNLAGGTSYVDAGGMWTVS